MQFQEDRIYTAVEMADFKRTLIEKYDYKIFKFEEDLKKASKMNLSKFRQAPKTELCLKIYPANGDPVKIYPAVPVFGKERIRNGSDKLVEACADAVLELLFDRLPNDEGYLYNDRELKTISLMGKGPDFKVPPRAGNAYKQFALALMGAHLVVSQTLATAI